MNHKARATIEQFAMLRQGDTVTVAVSGGADSVALLDFLCSVTDLDLHVRACHLNHCLRGEESDRDEQLVRTMCGQYGVPLDVRRMNIRQLARERGTSLEVTGREERYAFFAELAETYHSKIATAHTLSDTAETVLLNLSRGTGIAGLCGIPPVRGFVIRPLISCSREEIERYCTAHNLCYVTDSTNLSNDYTRNHIRHNIVPQLARVNQNALGAIGRMTDMLRLDADYLQQQALAEAGRCAADNGFLLEKLVQLHPAVLTRMISGILEDHGIERSAERIGLIVEMITGGKRHVLQVGKNRYITARGGILCVECRTNQSCDPLEQIAVKKNDVDGVTISLGTKKMVTFSVLDCADYEIFENNTDLVLKNAADYDKINADIFFRSRQAGDKMKPANRGCTKSLKKLFSELALENREQLCVAADSEGVVFVENIGVDERVKVDRKTRTVLTFTITEDNGGRQA